MVALMLALLAVAAPQGVLPANRLQPVHAPVRDAGVLHVATSTWTRKVGAAQLGADVLYSNACDDGYFSALSGDTYVSNGRVPSPTSPTNLVSRPGCAQSYTIDGFEFAYCTDQASVGTFTVDFFSAYGCCVTVIGVTPASTVPVSGLPGSPAGALACWTVIVDLDPNDSFVLLADGDGSYNGAPSWVDSFGWSIRSSLTAQTSVLTGPFIASGTGCQTCPTTDWDGTRWDAPIDYSEPGIGMGTCGRVRIEGGPTTPGCYFFAGGCPDADFHLRLFGDACGIIDDFGSFCLGDGTGAPCPCGNSSPAGQGAGCLSSLGIGGRLRGQGTASISADSVVLLGDQMPPNAPTLYFQGTIQSNGGAGVAFGDGKRCAGGSVIRLGISANSATGASSYPRPGDPSVSARGQISVPGTRTYQAWYRNAASFCTPATFNLSNGREIAWAP